MKIFLPGGLAPQRFLRDYWQKKPLLARNALEQYAALADRDRLFDLATRDDMESRVVVRHGARWQVHHGPFSRRFLQRLPRRNWTLLVQGVNHALPAAERLLRAFSFIPYARLDDVMASYAPPGGGVGPHFDSYDVFLLQGMGTRRWRISRQRDLELVPGAMLRILRRFAPRRQWDVTAGDVLYLPPRCAHDGVALTECVTFSVGFRAPGARELGARFLEYLADHLALDGIYADPDLAPARFPARIDAAMTRRIRDMLEAIRWRDRDVHGFLGEYLTEPKPHVVFQRPARPLTGRAFATAVRRHGVRLAPATQMLYRSPCLFINGERIAPGAVAFRGLARLADARSLAPRAIPARALPCLYPWYRAGYIIPGCTV